jgi:opacity protein-like surface antigen
MLRRIHDFAAAMLAVVCFAPAMQAAELYANATFMQSLGRDNSSGDIANGFKTVLGSDGDSSLAYGLGVGFGFDFEEVLPKKWDAWGTAFRIEGEFVYGREYEFLSNVAEGPALPNAGALTGEHFFDEVKAWTIMPINLYIDVPLRKPMSKIFGRVPRLEPFDFSFGFGAGVSHVHINAFDNTAHAVDGVYKFTFQANAAFSYEVNERVKIQFGYRYLDLGATDADLIFDTSNNGTPGEAGVVDLDLKAHEIVLAARWAFHQKPLAEMEIPMPRWLGGDGGDDAQKKHKPKKPKKKRRWLPDWLGGRRGP